MDEDGSLVAELETQQFGAEMAELISLIKKTKKKANRDLCVNELIKSAVRGLVLIQTEALHYPSTLNSGLG